MRRMLFQHCSCLSFLRRLNEGANIAYYKIGVRDDGYPLGLSDEDLMESLVNIKRMAAALDCAVAVRKLLLGEAGTIADVVFRRKESNLVAPLQVPAQ